MAEVWEAGSVIRVHLPSGEVRELSAPTGAEDIKRLAREAGLKKFVVKDGEGNMLSPSDFPLHEGEIFLEEYNEAA